MDPGDVSFHLVTANHQRVLAAVGVDHGNAHYSYRSLRDFNSYGSIECTNRKDITSWLEMVMRESQMRATGQVAEEIAHLGEPTPANPQGLYYVKIRCARETRLCLLAFSKRGLVLTGR
jgi:hypothetical protein